ncbi:MULTISPECIES: hypothetical protein [unclassified Mucilaginibacter]|uniref:hypothetical protein n=1 Tax=unclassified Mucilaginibacter TaxID=2617802 RepID=UPI002AC9A794|nr:MULTISPECIES: hypothetical protein [unclassified Mucilaginibacter]MEB0260907.1 hypothetical protein [Mucilaginibacter sp. 10I4]MEB0279857.1 hypothetical protein [Mucilaginibacter sp. 10B2]MEB0302464.1 hypothetical protein [Mucilaginibacter sp. 5C4]WPX24172.1 hypothetical protein RHM67_02635 [Mucilaginibacter sp. 5C4]
MKTYNKKQRSTFSAMLLTAVIALCFSVNVNAHSVNRAISTNVAAIDTGKMKMKDDKMNMKDDKMKMKKKKMSKIDKKVEADKMAEDKMGSKM